MRSDGSRALRVASLRAVRYDEALLTARSEIERLIDAAASGTIVSDDVVINAYEVERNARTLAVFWGIAADRAARSRRREPEPA